MDNIVKQQLLAEIKVVQSLVMTMDTYARNVQSQANVPITIQGPIAMVPALNAVAQALLIQKEAMSKLTNLLEKALDKL